MIVSDRGKQRSLHDTYYGNPEEGFLVNKMFVEEMDKYPELWSIAQSIEGLETSCSSHAGGVIIVDEDFTNTSSMMKLNSGDWVSCWDLHESEDSAGQVKIDLLATEALTYIRTCLDLLVEAGLTPKMSTLKETYEKCIGVYNLDRYDSKMWERLGKGELLNIFQMDTPQGKQGISLVKPTNVEELTALNSVMRLIAEEPGAEQPMQKYTRFKSDNNAWDEEMDAAGLTKEERELLHSYLDVDHGLAVSQEEMMVLLLEPKIAGWPLATVDKCRKSIAKKNAQLYEELTEEFFKNAKEKELSENLANYVWNVLIAPQKTYSFCSAHGLAYSIVGLQEMNLSCKYPDIFWNTANLIVDSAGVDDGIEDNESDENETEEVKRAKKTMDYGRTASAIGKFQNLGVKILPPNINTSSYTFTPDSINNTITYGLRGITRISTDLINEIIKNRPYESINDFLSKIKINKVQAINLIKSGAFDSLEPEKDRKEILYDYIKSTCDLKKKLTLANLPGLIENNLIDKKFDFERKLFLFNKYLIKQKDGNYYLLHSKSLEFVLNNFDPDIVINGDRVEQKVWKKNYDSKIKPLQNYIKDNSEKLLEELNNSIVKIEWDKYASGNISHWEMESVSFYSHPHELSFSNVEYANFNKLPADPVVIDSGTWKGKEYKKFLTTEIAGTVIDKDKNHNTISLLTTNGVVIVKIFKDQFAEYDKQISQKNDDGTKTIVEKSWFERGTLLILQGFRRGSDFVLRKGRIASMPLITKIVKVNDDGTLQLKLKREEEIL